MIWFIRFILIALIAYLNYLRGYHYRIPSMIAMTMLTGLYFAIYYHTWWLFAAVGLPMYGCLSLHDGNRGAWCSLVALGASFALLLTGHLAWYWFIAYCGGNYLIGWIMNNPKIMGKYSIQLYIDLVTGIGFGLIVL